MRCETVDVASKIAPISPTGFRCVYEHQVLGTEDGVHPVVEAEQCLDHLRIDQLDRKGLIARLHVEAVVEVDQLEADAGSADRPLGKGARARCAVTRSPAASACRVG